MNSSLYKSISKARIAQLKMRMKRPGFTVGEVREIQAELKNSERKFAEEQRLQEEIDRMNFSLLNPKVQEQIIYPVKQWNPTHQPIVIDSDSSSELVARVMNQPLRRRVIRKARNDSALNVLAREVLKAEKAAKKKTVVQRPPRQYNEFFDE